MRVISGKLKGKKIDFLKNFTTRPLKDSVKENIFNVLTHSNLIKIQVEGSNILDLYSGIGSFGIECLSRGANEVTFVERDLKTIKILKKNLDKLSLTKQSILINNKVENIFNKTKKFDIFFLDPPFLDKGFIKNLYFIKKNSFFEKEHLVIIHREKKSIDDINQYLDVLLTKIYGRSKIIFGKFN